MSSPFKTLAVLYVFALCSAAPNARGGPYQRPAVPDAFASADEKNASWKDSADSDGCFRSAEKDRSLAVAHCDVPALEVAARQGQADAPNRLGLLSALVPGKGNDLGKARQWFEKAARHGYAPAQVNLAVIYINGWGTAQNYGAALHWLTAAAKQGYPRANADLGILYMN